MIIRHFCAEPVELRDTNWRRDLGDLSFAGASSGLIPLGAELEIQVIAPSAGPGIEDILLLGFDIGGTPERRAISVHTTPSP